MTRLKAASAVADSTSKLIKIDLNMSVLRDLQIEDPIKMEGLIGECHLKTDSVMEGKDALQIVKCVNRKW